jgi:hypothetical protein
LPDAATQAYVYDNGGHGDSHVTSLTYKHSTTTIGNLTYTGACPERSRRDPDGRRSSVGRSLAAVYITAASGGTNTFNADNEMTKYYGAQVQDGTTLSYDANGQLTGDGL